MLDEAKKERSVSEEMAFKRGVLWSQKHPHWISVEEELPKNGVFVVAHTPNDMYSPMCCCLYGTGVFDVLGATHWMPLPTLPNVSNSENTGKNCITDEDPRGYDKEGKQNG